MTTDHTIIRALAGVVLGLGAYWLYRHLVDAHACETCNLRHSTHDPIIHCPTQPWRPSDNAAAATYWRTT